MTDRICSSCNKTFTFPYLLKRHLDGAYGCIPILRQPPLQSQLQSQLLSQLLSQLQLQQQQQQQPLQPPQLPQPQPHPQLPQLLLQQNAILANINNLIRTNQHINDNIVDSNNNTNVLNVNNNNCTDKIYKCNICNNSFKHRQSLFKHKKKCNINTINNNIQHIPIENPIIPVDNPLLPRVRALDPPPSLIENPLQEIIEQPLQELITNNTNNNIINNNNNNINNNINNINNIINININNEIINNYITNVHINPFGLETTDFLTLDQKKDILISSGDMAGIKILTMAYNKKQNKNFFKGNKKNSHITYINKDYELNVLEEHAFKKKIYSNSVNLLYSIFLDCLHGLTFKERIFISDNINYIEKDMYAEIFTNGLSNVKKEMIGELNQVIKKQTDINNSSNKIFANNFINNISNIEYLELSNNEVNKQIEKKKTIDRHKNGIIDINTIITDKVNLNELARELLRKHYIDTDFYKNLIIKETDEENKLKEKNNIGLYKKYSDIKKNREIKIKEVIALETDITKLQNYYSELID